MKKQSIFLFLIVRLRILVHEGNVDSYNCDADGALSRSVEKCPPDSLLHASVAAVAGSSSGTPGHLWMSEGTFAKKKIRSWNTPHLAARLSAPNIA